MHKNPPKVIALSVPHMAPDVQESMGEAFSQNWVAHMGATVDAFERELAAVTGVPAAFCSNSGSAALHLALRLCEVGPGDHVFCAALTFVASANPILYQGAVPVFIDSEPESWGMSPVALERALSAAKHAKRLPKAIIVVNLYGQSADLDPILELADGYGVPVIEDAAESLGATYKGRLSGTIGRIGIYSFAGNKILTTSAGGALVSQDKALVDRARFLGLQARDVAKYYQHPELGYNYRLSNVLAGIGRSQLRVLEQRVEARRAVFWRYQAGLAGVPGVTWMPEATFGRCNRWLSVMLLGDDSVLSAEELIDALGEHNIEARRVFKPLHLQPLHEGRAYFPHGEDVSKQLFEQGVCIPSSSSLTLEDQQYVIETITRLLKVQRQAADAS